MHAGAQRVAMAHQHFALRDELVEVAIGGILELWYAAETFSQLAAGPRQRFLVRPLQGHKHQARHQAIAQLRN